jgi:tetratricopeptide (TPR) repeat protein
MLSIEQLQLLPPSRWEDLENLIKDLFRAEWHDFHAQRHGRQGQAQQGVDVFGRPSAQPEWAGVQCKNKNLHILARLTVRELRDEVRRAKSFQPPLRQFIIATTAPRDARLQQEARKITDRHSRSGEFSVHVYGWDDIVELLGKHDQVAMCYYGGSLGTGEGTRHPFFSENTTAMALSAGDTGAADDADAATSPLVLSAPAARALGILATSSLPFPEQAYRQLFPDIDWKTAVPTLTAAKAVAADELGLHVPKKTKDSFLPTPAASRPYEDAWVAALEPLREHVDMAVLLSLQYLAKNEHCKAVDVVVELAPGLERGFWNELYTSVLEAYSQPKLLNRLPAERRRRFFHAYGLCLARGRSPLDALPWATRLRRASVRAGDHLGLAESLLLAGIAHNSQGASEQAADYFLRAAKHARRHRLTLVVGHALHNLAMMKSTSDPAAAARLLEESIRAKQQAGDERGRFGAMFGRGTLAVGQGQLAEAYKWFARAEKLAVRMDMRHERTLALCNMAHALVDRQRPRQAIPLYEAARKLAENESFADALVFALSGEAFAYMALRRFAQARNCFSRLHRLHQEMGQEQPAVIALHDAGVCLLKQGKWEQARKTLGEALVEARAHSVSEWIYRCSKDIALTHAEEGQPQQAFAALHTAATAEEKEGRFGIAAKLWESLATVVGDRSAENPLIEDAFLHAIAAIQREEDSVDERLRLLSGLYDYRWSSLAFHRALDTLREMERVARQEHRLETLARVLDQHGTCLQQLDRSAEAIADHRAALRVARRLPQTWLAEHCLSNLGEALRKTNRTGAAIRAYCKAEALAKARGDTGSAIVTAHNRALALEDAGRYAEAARVLRKCRGGALAIGLWQEYVRALHGLANHAWRQTKPDAAVWLYRKALTEAKKHCVWEHVGPISLNYANALRCRNQPRRAFSVLQSAAEHFLGLPDMHDYLAELASAAVEVGDLSAAKDYWDRARQHAVLVGATPMTALASRAVAEILEEEGDFTNADCALQEALATHHDPDEEATLLHQRLRVLLKLGNARKAGKVFSRLCKVTDDHALLEIAVDARMLVGDHEWSTCGS